MTDNLKISLFEQTEDDSIFIKECENWEEASKEMMATAKKNPNTLFKIKGFVRQEDGSIKLQGALYSVVLEHYEDADEEADEEQELFGKIQDLLINETYDESSSLLCSYLALRFAIHQDEFDSFEDYMKDIKKKIIERYNFNVHKAIELGFELKYTHIEEE
jgi:hypothetical protein